MKIIVVGLGYVGTSIAVLLAQRNQVVAVDTDPAKVAKINARQSPIRDDDITKFLEKKELDLTATCNLDSEVHDAEFVVICTPTNFDEETKIFDTSSVEAVIASVRQNNFKAGIVVKSTLPINFINKIRTKFKEERILFSPEFLREGQALHDNLFPTRIVVGDKSELGKSFAKLLLEGAIKEDIEIILTGPQEAEAIKLFANTYLAMRVAYINELDNYAMANNLSAKEIILGISTDPRIGNYYNNPSFGYGGYCLPKDTRQLLSNFDGVPQDMISAIVKSNRTRMDFLAATICKRKPSVVGVYRLVMKKDSDNFREAAVNGLINRIKDLGIELLIYEPDINEEELNGIRVISDISDFKSRSDVILANRQDEELSDVENKIFTRDVFQQN